MRIRALALVVGLALPAAAVDNQRVNTSLPSFRIQTLTGALVGNGSSDIAPFFVRLTPTLCDTSPPKGGTYPETVQITHFEVQNGGWDARRTVVDHPPFLVPFQETWGGRHCGRAEFDDPVPSEHYGVESLGNPLSCYGVGLTIVTTDGRHASKRALIRCGGIGSLSCVPSRKGSVPRVAGLARRVAVERVRRAGFKASVSFTPSRTVPAGIVLSEYHISVCKGTEVALTVSSGRR